MTNAGRPSRLYTSVVRTHRPRNGCWKSFLYLILPNTVKKNKCYFSLTHRSVDPHSLQNGAVACCRRARCRAVRGWPPARCLLHAARPPSCESAWPVPQTVQSATTLSCGDSTAAAVDAHRDWVYEFECLHPGPHRRQPDRPTTPATPTRRPRPDTPRPDAVSPDLAPRGQAHRRLLPAPPATSV